MLKHAALIGAFILLFYIIKDYSKKLESEPIADDYEDVRPVKKAKRTPASLPKLKPRSSELYKPSYKETQKNDSNFVEEVERYEEEKEKPLPVGQSETIYGTSFGSRSISSDSYDARRSSRSTGSSSSTDGSGNYYYGGVGGGLTGGTTGGDTGGTTTGGDTGDSGNSGSGSAGSGTSSGGSNSLTCNPNQGGGAYANPILVSISCSASSTIKYCLSQSGCCDPSSGATYSSSILVGANDGDYCLSFIGETASGVESSITEVNYTITSGLPHLQTSHPKTYYQTTELQGISFLTSNDFGRSNYEMGQVNLKTHDPGPSGLNLGCKDMLENYVLFPPVTPTPAPNMILTINDLSTINPGSQIEVPLMPADLDYGDNFIMSFVVDNSEATAEYACSTSKVVLYDFDYFEANTSHGEVGTAVVREFSAGFSPYGFFEEEATIYRGPAGVSSDEQSGQRLEAGLFEIFY